jgi:beta-hydroxylase
MLKTIFAPQFVFLYLLAASTIYVHFRGRERLRIARQLTRPISPPTTC